MTKNIAPPRRQWSYERPTNEQNMAKGSPMVASVLILMMLASTCMVASTQADSSVLDEIDIMHTAVNPDNNKTYHLLSASSWEDAAFKARSLDGYLTTIDDDDENTWVFDTFASFGDQSRHLWIGLNDVQDEGIYRWHDGTPFLYRNWGVDQPTGGDDSDYVHIASTNMGNIDPQTWNDLENNPEYFPVYGVVEVGPGADFSLRFDGVEDHIVIDHDEGLIANGTLNIEATIKASSLDGIRFITMKGDYGWGMYLSNGAIGYASEYSLSKHPTSNMSITEDTWHTIGVQLIEGVGGFFTIDGVPAGNISAEDANIPEGDFGS
ncbi:MAG: lectin-like protein, partial [Candidatus Poseidoniaceae archaeon]